AAAWNHARRGACAFARRERHARSRSPAQPTRHTPIPARAPRHARGTRVAHGLGPSDRDLAVTAVELTVNGRAYREEVQSRLLLSDFLRHTLGLTGTHVGCEPGVCG